MAGWPVSLQVQLEIVLLVEVDASRAIFSAVALVASLCCAATSGRRQMPDSQSCCEQSTCLHPVSCQFAHACALESSQTHCLLVQCMKSVAGVSTTYAACSALDANFNGGYELYWTVQQSASETLLHAAYASSTSDGFVGWGIPATPGAMIGGNGIIVKNNASAATGASISQESDQGASACRGHTHAVDSSGSGQLDVLATGGL